MKAAVEISGATVDFGKLKAVDNVTLGIRSGTCFGLVGESGSGKTTLMRAILGLQPLAAGRIVIEGINAGAGRRERARIVQAIFQDPGSSLSPRRTVGQLIAEVGELLGEPAGSLRARMETMLRRMNLAAQVADKYPYQLSGGQARRVALLRALLVNPRVLIADEPTAGLDVSVQGDLLNLLQDLRREQGLTLVVVSHNLAVVRLIADDAAVMYRGRLVEQGSADQIFDAPEQEYTRTLLQSWPRLPGAKQTIGESRIVR